MYVLKCVELYIKPGGFTKDISQAKKFATRKEAERARVYGWEIVKVR